MHLLPVSLSHRGSVLLLSQEAEAVLCMLGLGASRASVNVLSSVQMHLPCALVVCQNRG